MLEMLFPPEVKVTGTTTVLFGLAGIFRGIESWGPFAAAAES